MAVLWNSESAASAMIGKEVERGAMALGLQIESLEFKGPNGLHGVLAKKVRAQALLLVTDPAILDQLDSISRFAIANGLASFGTFPGEAQAGILATYGPNLMEIFRQAATFVDKILRGTKPADLPIERPTKYAFVINMKTAQALGIKVPQSILLRADRVIE